MEGSGWLEKTMTPRITDYNKRAQPGFRQLFALETAIQAGPVDHAPVGRAETAARGAEKKERRPLRGQAWPATKKSC
jgi:hypothetical protein